MTTPLEQALGRLVADGTLTGDQARAVGRELAALPLPATGGPSPDRGRPAWSGLVAEIGGYVGGSFVLAAALVLVGPNWGRVGYGARIALLGVPGLVMLAAAAAVLATTVGGWPVRHRDGAGSRRRLAAALVVVGGGLVASAVTVAADLGYRWEPVLWFGVATAIGAAAYTALRQSFLHVATASAAGGLVTAVAMSVITDYPWEAVGSGSALLALAVVWVALALAGVLAETGLGLTVAGVIAFVGGEVLALGERLEWVGFAALAVVAVAGLAGYVRSRHVGVLVVGVGALATVVPQATVHFTNGELGAAGALLVTGLSILGASVLGLRLRSTTADDPTDDPTDVTVTRAA
jgi:hypothetical protein